ncbi:type IV pilus modification protein PilV [Psychromonas antarctica]|uniref:type IV pilus modification protein PilV n=1 Tax=Psychromonas antarctica TaxID=67573 RepID=UPI001EE78CEB|nr:type IV pilus modification protein PilV [Psychromonas antarctica]MCG6201142.1 type IV pilus modification protein PilV [Psychromonas antarctica]
MKKAGFSLIEIMITSFVLALGLLGLAGMQSTAIKSRVEIQQRTLANSLAADISERMQLNRQWLQAAGNDYAISSLMEANLTAPTCVDNEAVFDNCSGEDIKNNDLYEWKNKFIGANVVSATGSNAGLIEADACIEVDSDNMHIIVLSWFSIIKSKDAAAGDAVGALTSKCGVANTSRRQLMVKTYVGKSI